MSRITFSNIVTRLKQLSKTAQARAKIEQTFQVNNRVRRTNVSGARAQQTFTVYEVDCSTARVLSEDETLEFYVSWFSPDGHFLSAVADNWELVARAPKAVAPQRSYVPEGVHDACHRLCGRRLAGPDVRARQPLVCRSLVESR
jgi:hypothetical protein